jgi:hypothetical protein
VALLCGCTQRQAAPQAVEVAPKVYFSENFSQGLGNWEIRSAGGGSMEVVDRKDLVGGKSLMMRSQFSKSATAFAPRFQMDWNRDYAVALDFMLSDRDNFGYTIYRDRNVELDLGEATGIMCGILENAQFAGRIDTFGWHRLGLVVRPGEGEYEVFIDGARQKNCPIGKNNVETFMFGDPDSLDIIHGDGYWANIRVTDRL